MFYSLLRTDNMHNVYESQLSKSNFKFTEKLRWKHRHFLYVSCPHACIVSIINFFTKVTHLFQLLSLHWHLIITKNHRLPGGFTLGVVNAGDVDSIPAWGRSPGEGNGHPLQYSWEYPIKEEPEGLQSIESQRVRQDCTT